MSNMSYCRFENTSRDLADCLDALTEALEEGKTLKEFLASLSSDSERQSFNHLNRLALKFSAQYEELEFAEAEGKAG